MLDNASRRRLGRRRAAPPRDDGARRARATAREGRERLRPAPALARALLPAAQRGLRASPGRHGRAARGARSASRAPPRRARGCCDPTGACSPRRGASPRPRPRSSARSSCIAATPCRAPATTIREVDWAQSAALLVRREAAEQIGWFDPAFFVYSDEVDFCKRLRDAGWRTLYVPRRGRGPPRAALDGGRSGAPDRRAVAQPRPLHAQAPHGAGGVGGAAADGVHLRRAGARRARAPRHDPRRYWRHVTATLHPSRGEGLREAASEHNRGRRL